MSTCPYKGPPQAHEHRPTCTMTLPLLQKSSCSYCVHTQHYAHSHGACLWQCKPTAVANRSLCSHRAEPSSYPPADTLPNTALPIHLLADDQPTTHLLLDSELPCGETMSRHQLEALVLTWCTQTSCLSSQGASRPSSSSSNASNTA